MKKTSRNTRRMTARTIKRMPGSRELIAGHGKDTMETTLVIMAAGMGSRFGSGIKQLAEVGPGGEIIMDYSIYAAKEAGFDNVVFIIRRDIEEAFRLAIGDRIEKYIPVKYVYQELENAHSLRREILPAIDNECAQGHKQFVDTLHHLTADEELSPTRTHHWVVDDMPWMVAT